MKPSATTYARRLGLFDATMVVVGGMIGAGIFLNPAIVAQRVGTPTLALGVWALGGLVALAGALCYAELGAHRPRAGGSYVYIAEAFGPLAAFLYGWTVLLVSNSGSIAAVAVAFAQYAAELAGLADSAVVPTAIAAVVFLSAVNYLGIRPGSITQNIFTVLKLAALAFLITAGLALVTVPAHAPAETGAAMHLNLFFAAGAALIPVLFAYGGWHHANHIAAEIREPERNLPRALLLGVAIVVAVYLLANLVYLRALGIAGLAGSRAPASDVLRSLLGPAGSTLIAAGVVTSTFGLLNLYILAAPRVYQAMADDGLFSRRAAHLHPRYRTPGGAIVFQAAWTIVLTWTGSYGQLLDYVVFGDGIFFGLTAACLFVYRRRERSASGFRAAAYPWTPAFFILAEACVVVSIVASNPRNALLGVVLIAAGVPVYRFWARAAKG